MGEGLVEKVLFEVTPSITGPMKQKKDAESILNVFFVYLTIIPPPLLNLDPQNLTVGLHCTLYCTDAHNNPTKLILTFPTYRGTPRC